MFYERNTAERERNQMASQDLIDAVGRYIDRYYEPVNDDIKIDKEMESVFSRIANLRKKRAEQREKAERQLLQTENNKDPESQAESRVCRLPCI